jgi:hypothetical protein
MLAGLYAKLGALLLVLGALAGLYVWGHHAGAAAVQARWNAAQAQQAAAAANQRAASAQQTFTWLDQFQTIATRYEAATHETLPAVSDAVATAVDHGAVRLRGSTSAACPETAAVSGATARARAADAAATQALADRIAYSIAAVRAGDDADERERQLGEQVKALQAILQAERQPTAPAAASP